MRRHVWLSLLLMLLTLVCFWEIQRHEFVNFDDSQHISGNPFVSAGFTQESVRWAFASGKHPLTWLSHMLDVELYQSWAGGHHRTSLLFHLANVLLLFFVLRRATGAEYQSAAVAALFAIHPLHVESVAWASERKDVLSTFFWLLCIGGYLRYVEAPGIGRYLVVVGFAVLGLMSKSMLVTLPFTLLLLDYWPLQRLELDAGSGARQRSRLWRVVAEKIPLFALAAISATIAYEIQRSSGNTGLLRSLAWTDRVANALVAYASYIHKTFWPRDLIFFYPHPEDSLGVTEIAGAMLLLVATSFAIWRARRHRYLTFGWLWFLGTLVPVIGLVQIGKQAMADRYTYVPHIGLFVAIVWGISEASSNWRCRKSLLTTAAIALALILTVATRSQVAHWQDSLSLSAHAVEVMPDNALAHHILGQSHWSGGRPDEAIEHYQRAIEIEPDFVDPHVDLASALDGSGRTQEAVDALSRVLAIRPDHAIANYNLGMIQARSGEIDAAISTLRRAAASSPTDASVQLGLGSLLAGQRRFEEAEPHFLEALRADPHNASTYAQLGGVHAMWGRYDDAIREFETALRLDPRLDQARVMLDLARKRKSEQMSE